MLFALCSLAVATTPVAADSIVNRSPAKVAIFPTAELGFVAPLAHTIAFGKDGSTFDYVEDGGQDVLFPFVRLSVDLDVGRSSFLALYQPLDIVSTSLLQRTVRIDGVDFAAGEPLTTRYGFTFWRGSWLYDLLPSAEREVAFGLGLQIRDANIEFTSGNGEQFVGKRNVGPVPVLSYRGRFPVGQTAWIGAQVEGMYAPIKYLNGGDVDVEGALLDATIKAGLEAKNGVTPFIAIRYLGGGAEGTSAADGQGDGYTSNWLHTMTVSLGGTLR